MSCVPLMDREPGTYPLEELPAGWANVQVSFTNTKGEVVKRYEILDRRHKGPPFTRYLQEPMAMIAFKCLGLAAGLFLYFPLYTFVHLVRLPVVTLVNCSPTAFAKQLWAIVRIPFYFLALEFSALYGIFSPLKGRALFGDLECLFHDGKGRRASIQYGKDKTPFLKLCWETLSLKEDPRVFFAGFCMQPIGSTDDPHILKVEFLQNPPTA